MRMNSFLLFLLFVAGVVAGYIWGDTFGYARGYAQAKELAPKIDCFVGQHRPCVFGPGIAGTQECRQSDLSIKWDSCEPTPVNCEGR